MKKEVEQKMKKYLKPLQTLILGISGGSDSVALLHFLNSLKKKYKWKLIVAHVNHQLRGKESDLDARFVKNLARKMKLPYEEKTVDLKKYSLEKYKKKQNLEEAGRELRYDFFNSLLKKYNADWITLAHQANDNIETMLINLMRGSSVTGLKGMSFTRKNIIRPFLSVKKKEILNYLSKNKLSFRQDKTNFDTAFTRNYIRHEILPRLEKIQPRYETILQRERTYFEELDEFLKKTSRKLLKSITVPRGNKIQKTDHHMDEITIKRASFLDLDFFLQKEILKHIFIKIHGSTKGLSQKRIEEVKNLIHQGKTGKKKHFSSCLVEISRDLIYFKTKIYQRNVSNVIKKTQLLIPGKTVINKNLIIKTKLLSSREFVSKPKNYSRQGIIFLDFNKIKEKIWVRSWKNGDKIRPLGLNGSKKIQDIFVDKKIPQDQRKKIPIFVLTNGKILAIDNFMIHDEFKITTRTKQILKLLKKDNSMT